MSENTWSHRLARPVARRLAAIGVRPNAVTLLRLASGVAAASAFAVGTRDATIAGGLVFVVSCFLDRLDGEIARVANAGSDFGEKLDRYSDLAVTALVFTGIGIGQWNGALGNLAPAMGIVAAAAVITIYALRHLTKLHYGEAHTDTKSVNGIFDHDDALYLIGPIVWIGLEVPLLVLASVGAPIYALYVWWRYRSLKGTRLATSRSDFRS